MTQKVYVGIGILMIVVIGSAIFLLNHNVDTEPEVIYKPPAKEVLDNIRKKTEPGTADLVTVSEQNRQRRSDPASNNVPMSDDSKQVDVGMSDETSDGQETDNTPDFWSLSREVQQQILDQFYIQHGLKPPPRGYQYRWKDINVPLLDENGNPVLHKIGEPIVDIQMRVDFAPTREEFERYNQLLEDQGWAEARGDFDEVERLSAEIEALEAAVQRVRPVHVMTSAVGDEAIAKSDRVTREKLNAALREHGLEHLISPWE